MTANPRSELLDIDVGDERMFGVAHVPSSRSVGTVVVILPRRVTAASTEWNGVRREIAVELATRGVAAVRFDWIGAGASTGRGATYRRNVPRTAEVAAAVAAARSVTDADQVIAVGSCYGASMLLTAMADGVDVDAALLTTLQLIDTVAGADRAMAERQPTTHYVRRALTARTIRRLRQSDYRRSYARMARAKFSRMIEQVDPRRARVGYGVDAVAVRQLIGLARSGVPLRLVYGTADPEYPRFVELARGPLAPVVDAPSVEVATVPGKYHGLTSPEIVENYRRTVLEWALGRAGIATTS